MPGRINHRAIAMKSRCTRRMRTSNHLGVVRLLIAVDVPLESKVLFIAVVHGHRK